MKPIDVVKSYYAAFDAHDFARARALMRDDFRFVGPMMEANSPEEMFSKMRSFDCEFKNCLLQTAEDGNTVATIFDCVFTRPFSATIRMSEWFTVQDGKIASSNLVYDTRQMPTPTGS
jgi:ketosteroid isomerase-like protein